MTMDRDERLAAWLDGALPPAEAAAFADELAQTPALAEQAAAWRINDQRIAEALVSADRPIDDALLVRLRLAAEPEAANDNPRWPRLSWLAAGSALAAGVAAVMVLTLRQPAPADPLSEALDRTASLASTRLADGRTITPTLTVRAADGRWCREFRAGNETALACRAQDRWTIEARARGAEAADTGAITVAGGADPAALDGAYQKLKASDPLSAAEEQTLLGSHWR